MGSEMCIRDSLSAISGQSAWGWSCAISGGRRRLARGSQEHGGQRRALVVGDGVCVGGERQQRAVVASALAASGGSERRQRRLREEQWTGRAMSIDTFSSSSFSSPSVCQFMLAAHLQPCRRPALRPPAGAGRAPVPPAPRVIQPPRPITLERGPPYCQPTILHWKPACNHRRRDAS